MVRGIRFRDLNESIAICFDVSERRYQLTNGKTSIQIAKTDPPALANPRAPIEDHSPCLVCLHVM